MYAPVIPRPDARGGTRRYVGDVAPSVPQLTRLIRWFQRQSPWTIDAALGSVFTVLGLVGLLSRPSGPAEFRDPNAFAVVLALGCSLPLFVRRRAPFSALLVSVTSVVVLTAMQFPSGVQSQTLIIFAYSAGSWCTGIRRPLGFAAIVAGVAIVAAFGIPDASTANILLVGAIYVAAYFLGTATRNHRLYTDELERRTATLERERDEQARRAVADERLRIAQELHDVVAHSMGVIAVQAGVGAHVIDDDPAEAKRALDAIATTSRTALTEIRRLLGGLRSGGAAYEPAPGLADLGRLVADLADAGLAIEVHVDGERGDVPPGVDLTAYRIVQEALTNVLRHAGPARARVCIGYQPQTLRLEIVDDGRGVDGRASAGGHGLLGMRERVGVYGGSLDAGPRSGGGFGVVAVLPYGEPR